MTPSLVVVALGGNAISPPAGDLSFAGERTAVAVATAEIAAIARGGARLLVVHGNGPQVGRLLAARGLGDAGALDLHVAQTQGELGYLVAHCLERELGDGHDVVALVTRVIVDAADAAFDRPEKPVGTVLAEPPRDLPAVAVLGGWRRAVASPRPSAVVEMKAIEALLATHHVVAGGGGGIAMTGERGERLPCPAVVDKDWVASLLAIRLAAAELIYVTDVPSAFDDFGGAGQRRLATLDPAAAREGLARGLFAPGSMAPKVASAADFVEATGRRATITCLGAVAAARRGQAGTVVRASAKT